MLTFSNSGSEAGVVLAGVAAPALPALDRAQRRAVSDREHRLQVEREVPAGVELMVPSTEQRRGPLVELGELLVRLDEFALGADDADEVLHRVLQGLVHRVGVLGALVGEEGNVHVRSLR